MVIAVVPAAGAGRRLQRRLHKAFVCLKGRPLLVWTLEALESSKVVEGIVVVVPPGDVEAVQRMLRRFRIRKVLRVVEGGATRTASVFFGLKALPEETRWVVIHDGARPLVPPGLIRQTLQGALKTGCAIAAVPVVPTVKEAKGFWVVRTLNRNHLWAVQTPQVFRRDLLQKAHGYAQIHRKTATDDSTLVEALGHRVRIVIGSPRNLKVTTPEDLVIAEAWLSHAGRNRI